MWGAVGGAHGTAAMLVCVVGLRPGVAELEVQRGSVLGSSKPLLVLPAGTDAAAAEVHQLFPSDGSGGGAAAASDAFLRDLGAVVAWSEQRGQGRLAAPHVTLVADGDSAYSSSEDDSEEECDSLGTTPHQIALWQVPLLPAALVAGLATHAAHYSRSRSWTATAVLLEAAAATAAVAAVPAEAAAEAARPPSFAPAHLQHGEHAPDPLEVWAPALLQQPLPAVGQHGKPEPAPGARFRVRRYDGRASLE